MCFYSIIRSAPHRAGTCHLQHRGIKYADIPFAREHALCPAELHGFVIPGVVPYGLENRILLTEEKQQGAEVSGPEADALYDRDARASGILTCLTACKGYHKSRAFTRLCDGTGMKRKHR